MLTRDEARRIAANIAKLPEYGWPGTDPHDLMRPFPAEPMWMWLISTRVNKPENDDPSIVEPIVLDTSAA